MVWIYDVFLSPETVEKTECCSYPNLHNVRMTRILAISAEEAK